MPSSAAPPQAIYPLPLHDALPIYGVFDENTSQRPFGDQLCHEFIVFRLQLSSRSFPPANGTIYKWLSGRISSPFLLRTNTIHLPSGDTFGKLLLIPFSEPPISLSALPPLPSLNGILYRSYCICVSLGSLAYSARGCPVSYGSFATACEYTRYLPSGLQNALVCTKFGSSAPGRTCNLPVSLLYQASTPRVGKNTCPNP